MAATYEMTLAEFKSQFVPVLAGTFYPKWTYNDTERACKTQEEQERAIRGFHRDDILEAVNSGLIIPQDVRLDYPEIADLFDKENTNA